MQMRLLRRIFSPALAVRLVATSTPPVVEPLVSRILSYVDIVKGEAPDNRRRAIIEHGASLTALNTCMTELRVMYDHEAEGGELRAMAADDMHALLGEIDAHCATLTALCQPFDETDRMNSLQMEIEPGAGGQEAMLFAADLVGMYTRYAAFRQWSCEVIEQERTDHNGYVKCVLRIAGDAVYKSLKFEGGVHRVQRTPKTESRGRVHTSTASVAIMPEPSPVQVDIKAGDCMNVDHNDTAVRVVHAPTGIAVESQESRKYERNRDIAMKRLITIIFERQMAKLVNRAVGARKLQVGSRDRSEKIRTYNMAQDRVTDHRLKQSFHQVPAILLGGAEFHEIVQQCAVYSDREALLEVLDEHKC